MRVGDEPTDAQRYIRSWWQSFSEWYERKYTHVGLPQGKYQWQTLHGHVSESHWDCYLHWLFPVTCISIGSSPVHLVYERVLRLLPDISNFDNSSAGVITAPRNVNDDRKTIRWRAFWCLMHRSYRARILSHSAICFVNCHWETSWRKWYSLSTGILEVVSK